MHKIAEYNDCWRHINSFKNYRYIIKSLHLEGISGFQDFEIKFTSAINAICGRNGIGKSTLLKIIYKQLTQVDIFNSKDTHKFFGKFRPEEHQVEDNEDNEDNDVLVGAHVWNIDTTNCYLTTLDKSQDNRLLQFDGNTHCPFNVEYIDASSKVIAITNMLSADKNPLDLIDGIDPNTLITENIDSIIKITGKKYSKIKLYEISWQDQIIPFILAERGGISYDSRTMGFGEHKLLYLIWKTLIAPKNSFLLIDEPESFICPRSQNDLMDFIASIASKNKLTIIFSTHSEHIIKKLNINSWHILKNNGRYFDLVQNKRKEIVMELLGVIPEKESIILVEDFFAAQTLKGIISVVMPDWNNSVHIEFLNGESDIIEILRHYPAKNSNVKITGVFDADQKGKIQEHTFDRPILFLPAKRNIPPETEIIDFIKTNAINIYVPLGIEPEDIESHVENNHEELHDWLHQLSSDLRVDYITCINVAIRAWINANKEEITLFCHVLRNIHNTMQAKIEREGDVLSAVYSFGKIKVIHNDKIENDKNYPTKFLAQGGSIFSKVII